MVDVCVAFKAHQGWVNAVVVLGSAQRPTPLIVARVDLVEDDDPESLSPYHVAGGWKGLERVPQPADPAAVVERGRHKQTTQARAALKSFGQQLENADMRWVSAVMLIGRGRLGDLDHILASHAHIHVAEGEAIRDATRAALTSMDIAWVDQDEKSILELAATQLAGAADDPDSFMKPLKPEGSPSWRKEERLIALGAWLHRG